MTAEDSFNEVSGLYNGTITLSVETPSGTPLGGTISVTAVNGMAEFSTISLASPGTYTLSAVDSADSTLSGSSTSFVVRDSKIWYVDQNAPAGGDGYSSWGSAFNYLQTAIGDSIPGDSIYVAQGHYSPGSDPTSTYTLPDGVTIEGGFLSGQTHPNPAAYTTYLDGMGTNYHVVTGNGTNSTAVLEDVTITNGSADGSGIDPNSGFGGGLIVDGGSPTIKDCTFTANTAVMGGGLYINNWSGSTTLSNLKFLNNTATDSGGAMYLQNSSPVVVNCLFTGNTANQGGGAIYNFASSSPIITNCTFASNSAIGLGGAIYDQSVSTPVLTNDIFYQNLSDGGSRIDIAGDYVSSQPVINYSYIYNPNYISGGYTGGTGLVVGQNVDAGFVNAAGGNYQLQPTSPCINVGNITAILPLSATDLAGNSRFIDNVDLGAYEAQSVTITWTGAQDEVTWGLGGNWSDNQVPTANDDVIVANVSNANNNTVLVSGGSFAVKSLTASHPIDISTQGALQLYGTSITTGGFIVENGGTLSIAADPVVLVTNGLAIQSGGTVDIGDSCMVVQNSTIGDVTSEIASGYNGGAWTGSGIISSVAQADPTYLTTVGVILNNDGVGNPLYGPRRSPWLLWRV